MSPGSIEPEITANSLILQFWRQLCQPDFYGCGRSALTGWWGQNRPD